ncbi:MAG: PHP domain-containing protein [Clostridiales bacterium]|nr:PHP domain-containing protein [Eubacteriales bacterium]MDH7566901.1 PHP domain-containing protein [Clostridiales bacterium]
MDGIIDLHTHTTASDGSMNPGALVRHARAKGLAAIAVTDHDTVDGIEEALEEGEKLGIEVVPGLEISVDYKPEMHILGYFFNNTYKNIRGTLNRLKRSREVRNPKIIGKLNELGFCISLDEVKAEAKGEIVGRPHIAKVLMDKGYVKSIEEAFDKYLSSGKPAYFKKEKLTPEEGIRKIIEAGGIPALAHPIYLNLSLSQLDDLLGRLKQAGLKGIEAYYVDNTKDETGNFLRLAMKHELLATGGSDFHGSFKPDIEIGVGRGNLQIHYEVLEKLKGIGFALGRESRT